MTVRKKVGTTTNSANARIANTFRGSMLQTNQKTLTNGVQT